MGFKLPRMVSAKQTIRRTFSASEAITVPKGHFVVYVGETEKKRFVIPIHYLQHPSFQNLLSQAKEEYRFNHPTGGLTIPRSGEAFTDLTSSL